MKAGGRQAVGDWDENQGGGVLGLSGKETKYLCEYGISCFCLWATGITGILVSTIKKISRKILFLFIFFWKVKVTL